MTVTALRARQRLDAELDGLVTQGVVPGGVAVVATPDGVLHERAFGRRALEPESEPSTLDTLWDMASVTKALVTAPLLLLLRRRQALDFAQPVSEWVPEMADGARSMPRMPTIAQLLLHAGGLPSWKPLYAVAPGGLAERAAWLGRNREEPGRESAYGCPGYQILGLVAERASGRSLSELAAAELWPGRDDLHLGLPAPLAARAAPTERGNAFERRLAGDAAAGYDGFRERLIRGEVHDHNAWTLGGVAGNAGLFATGAAAAWLAGRFLVPDDLLDGDDLAELRRDLSGESGASGESRTWGFQCATSSGSAAGSSLSPRSFGHVGFTGTSVFVDPERRAVHVLLTNRVHPLHSERPFNADRRAFHAASAAVVEQARG